MSQRLRIDDLLEDIIGADSGNEDDSEDGNEDEDLDDQDSEDNEDEDGEDDEPTVESLQAEVERLTAEKKRADRRMRAADRAKTAAEQELARLRDGGQGELAAANDRVKELEAQLAAARGDDQRSIVREAFRDFTEVNWHNPKLAFEQLDLSEVDVENGVVDLDSLRDAVQDLTKKHPYLVKKASKAGDDEDEQEKPAPRGPSGASPRSRKPPKKTREAAVAEKWRIGGRVPIN